jgi:hypothetical protein
MKPLRPDEEANEREIERNERFNSNVKRGVKTAGNLAISASGVGLSSKLLPFLSKYIPPDLAIKGINKVSPKIGGFLEKGAAMGLDVQEGLNFLKDKLEPKEQEGKEPAKENRNIIQQYSPGLFQYISDLIKEGNTPIEAGAKALKFLDDKHRKVIKQMEKDHKTDWSSIVQSVFGNGQMAQEPNQGNAQQAGNGAQGLDPGVAQILQQGQALLQRFKGR